LETNAHDAVFRAKWIVRDAHLALKYRAAESTFYTQSEWRDVFYERHFAMRELPGAKVGPMELESPPGGCTIALHKADRRAGRP
jgi:hypothetical protein